MVRSHYGAHKAFLYYFGSGKIIFLPFLLNRQKPSLRTYSQDIHLHPLFSIIDYCLLEINYTYYCRGERI